MKNNICIYFLILSFNINCSSNQQINNEIYTMLEEFYFAYNKIWNSEIDFQTINTKLDSVKQLYCTSKLLTDLKSSNPEHDLLIDDLYTDSISLKNSFSIENNNSENNCYTVSYTAIVSDPIGSKTERTATINLIVVNINGSYKIDEIK